MSFSIPLFDLNFDNEEEQAVLDTLRSKWISIGPKCEELETMFAEMLDCKYAISLTNCTSSLHLALKIFGIGKGDEVITPSLTFTATVNVIRYVDARPVFCDIKSYEDLTIDPDQIEQLITPNTKAIIVMHYAGFPCDMKRILAIAEKNNLKVIEDACHGPLSEYNKKKLGTIGDIGCFSFFSNKNISTAEGGMLVTDNEGIYRQVKLLRSHGMTSLSYDRSKGHTDAYDVIELGFNYRMDDIRASIGIAQLRKLKKDLRKRAQIRDYYLEQLSGIDEIIIPFSYHKGFVSNYIFPIVLNKSTLEKRRLIRNKLHDKGIQTSVHYPAVHRFSIYKDFTKRLPITEYVADNEITLPMYSNLTDTQVTYICKILKDSF